MHTHTAPMSGCAYIDPLEAVRTAKRFGIDAVCFTEHDIVWPMEEVRRLADQSGILIFRGMEISTQDGHVLVFGMDEYVDGVSNVWRLKKEVDAARGAMILAHPARHNFTSITEDDLPTLFDALETQNAGDSDSARQFSHHLAERVGMKGTGGSDSHGIHEVAFCATEFEGDIRNVKDLVEAIKGNGYHAKRLRHRVNPQDLYLKLFPNNGRPNSPTGS